LDKKLKREAALRRQVVRLERRLGELGQVSNRYAWARLLTFVGGIIFTAAVWIIGGAVWGIAALVISLIAFRVVAGIHSRVKGSLIRHGLWRDIKTAQIARMALDWERITAELKFRDYADRALELDLDLTGDHSLHRLIDTTVSREASTRLRDWLATTTPDPDQIARRQALVRELVAHTLFRYKLRLNGTLTARGANWRWEGDRVRRWLDDQRPTNSLRPYIIGLTALAGVNMLLFVLTQVAGIPPLWGFTFMAYLGIYLWKVQLIGDPFGLALALRDPLSDLRTVFEYLENAPYGEKTHLRTLCAPFLEADRPSAQLKRVERVLAAASVRHNPILWMLFSAVMPWDIYTAHWLNKSRAAVAERLPVWLDVWTELDAVCALANVGYLNPAYTFPELVTDGALFEGQQIGHPLLPDADRVCNDFTLRDLGDVALITGSNMSGKSTFLRTVGINLCLAYAGGMVNGQRLRIVPFRLFTCIRVTDSVTDGISYFYAEVKRLKALLVELEEKTANPLFFLIDEIFRGTNNRERLIGSRSYIRALVGKHGVGIISTHDLELVHLADELAQLTNYHFTETVGEGRLLFDYRMRPGPSPTTNALAIMVMEGLPVEGG